MVLSKEQIKEIIPYQEPFLFVDGVEAMTENRISHIKSQALVENDLKCEARFSVVIIDKKKFEEKYKK